MQTLVENNAVQRVRACRSSLLAGTTLTGNEVFAFTHPVNTDGGPLKGFEINYQQPFKFLPGKWSNFGMLLNYTHVDSTIDYVTSATGVTPPVRERPGEPVAERLERDAVLRRRRLQHPRLGGVPRSLT